MMHGAPWVLPLARVARSVGRSRMQVYRWMKRYNLNAADYRNG